jgi:glycosyltransferase involved in cell wall biosynthesis
MTATVSHCPPTGGGRRREPTASRRPAAPSVPALAPERDVRARVETVSVVIPAKNEALNLPWVLARLPDGIHELILVDGVSTDDTIAVARRHAPQLVLVHEQRPGKGAAIRAGFAAASGDIIVMLDADGSMDPGEIGRYVDAIRDGAALAKGSRRLPGGGSADITLIRDLGNRALLATANILFGTRFSELCYGFMAVRRDAVADLGLISDGFEIETEIVVRAVRAGLPVAEVPSFEAPRRAGASNLNAIRDGLRIVRTLLQVRTGIGRPRFERVAGRVRASGARSA